MCNSNFCQSLALKIEIYECTCQGSAVGKGDGSLKVTCLAFVFCQELKLGIFLHYE